MSASNLKPFASIIHLVLQAKQAEAEGRRVERNSIAQRIHQRSYRWLSPDKTRTVDSWYDRASRTWVTAIRDRDGVQLGDAMIDGNRISASVSLLFELYEFLPVETPEVRQKSVCEHVATLHNTELYHNNPSVKAVVDMAIDALKS